MTRFLSKQKSANYLFGVLLCFAAFAGAAYDAGWTRSECSTYSYHGLNERYVYGGNKGWIDNNSWDSTSVEGVDCASYVCRCLALPSYVAENQSATYPYTTSKLYAGVDHLVRINNVQDLQPWDIWVWRVEYGGPSTGHTGLVKELTSSSIITREALSATIGTVERTRSKQDMIDWGCRFYRRDNWAAASTVTVPSAQTNTANNINQTSATLNGAVLSDGGATIDSRGFAWGTTSACDGGWIDGTTSTTFSAALTGLNPDSQYYFQAQAHNSKGWGSGQVRSFVTGTAASGGSEIIVDNGSSGTSSTGTWGVSSGAGSYGTNSLWARNGATYTWRFTPPSAGTYEVYMWWTAVSSRGTAVPVAISHAAGTASRTVNQQTDGGQWNSLGQYYFNGSGAVKLTAAGSYPTSSCADAVRFVKVETADEEIIMDNGNNGTYYSGTWGVSGGSGAYGTNSLWARDTARYKWTFTPQSGGHYEVSLWWTEFSSRGTEIPVTVTNSNGSNALTVNQQTNGGQWNVLGTYPMTSGTTYSVLVETAGDGSTACADAIRVRWVSD